MVCLYPVPQYDDSARGQYFVSLRMIGCHLQKSLALVDDIERIIIELVDIRRTNVARKLLQRSQSLLALWNKFQSKLNAVEGH